MNPNSYTGACRGHLWFWYPNLPPFLMWEWEVRPTAAYWKLHGYSCSQSYVLWWKESKIHGQILQDPLYYYPCEFSSSWLTSVAYVHLVPSSGKSLHSCPILPCPIPSLYSDTQMWGRWINLYSWDCIVSSYWTLKGQLIAFALFTYSSVPKWASVSAAQLPLESVYLISIEFWHSHYTVQIVQIQQCASKSRISTFKELYWESWREKYQIQTAELVMCYSHFVAEDICVGYLSCRDVWENQLLMLCCDTLTVTNSCCLLPIDFQSAFSRVTLDSKGARCR